MVVPMEQWAGQAFQDKSADWSVVMLSDHNEKYSDRMERSYKAFDVNFELRFPFPLIVTCRLCVYAREGHDYTTYIDYTDIAVRKRLLNLISLSLTYWYIPTC